MPKLFSLSAACAAVMLASSLAVAAPAVVSVDLERIGAESEPARQTARHLAEVQSVLQQGLDDLAKLHEKKPDEEKQKILAEGLAVLNRQMELEKAAAMQAYNAVVVEEIEKWRKQNGVQLVIPRGVVITGDWDKADYTNTILRRVNKRTVKLPDLPKVSIKDEKK